MPVSTPNLAFPTKAILDAKTKKHRGMPACLLLGSPGEKILQIKTCSRHLQRPPAYTVSFSHVQGS